MSHNPQINLTVEAELAEINHGLDLAYNELRHFECRRDIILERLFADQETMAVEIKNEPEFKTLLAQEWTYKHPIQRLCRGTLRVKEYTNSSGTYFCETEYNDGEWADSIRLLNEFISGDEVSQREAIRNIYRATLAEANKQSDAALAKKLEEARKLLRENGVDI